MNNTLKEKVAVVGLGYVGLPLALALGRAFSGTVGFDISERKIAMLLRGEDPTDEGFDGEVQSSKNLFSSDPAVLKGCSVIIIAVPTPIDENKQPDLSPLVSASELVGKNLSKGAVVVYESTVYPGVTEDVCAPILEKVSGLKRSVDFFVGYSPERINPGDKEHTLEKIVKVVAGENPEVLARISSVYSAVVKAGLFSAQSIRVAEAAKVIENTQRDLNIALMNELAIIFDKMGIRTSDVLAAAGTKWNFLKFSPGLVGGHCIGVDPYYLTTKAQQLGYNPQVILAGRRINDEMGAFIAQRAVKLMINAGISPAGARVGVLGVTFKENVSDTRNSRVPDIVKELSEFGITPLVHDPIADPALVHEEYGITLSPWNEFHDLTALIVAVAHGSFKTMPTVELCAVIKKGGIFCDVKSLFLPTDVRDDLVYWSL